MKLDKKAQSELLKKDGCLKVKYIIPFNDIIKNNNNNHKRLDACKRWRGSFKNFKLNDTNYRYTLWALNYLDIKKEEWNDSPRGGAEGDYIKLTKKISKQKIQLMQELLNREAQQ